MTGLKAGAILGAIGLLSASMLIMGTGAALRPTDGELEALILEVGMDGIALVNDGGDVLGVVADDALTMTAEGAAGVPDATRPLVDAVPALAQDAADAANGGAAATAMLTSDAAGAAVPLSRHVSGSTAGSLGEARDFVARSGDRLQDLTGAVLSPAPPVAAHFVALPADVVPPSATFEVGVGPIDPDQLPPANPTVHVAVDPGSVSPGPLPLVAEHVSAAVQAFAVGTADDANRTGSSIITSWATI